MTAREQMPGPGRELLQDNGSMKARPGDGFLAEVSRRAALTAHQQKAGEETMVGPAQTHGADGRVDRDWRARGACRFSDPEHVDRTTGVDHGVSALTAVGRSIGLPAWLMIRIGLSAGWYFRGGVVS